MKKNLIICILFLIGIIYLLISISRPDIYLNDMSMSVKNPISLDLMHINIDTGVAENSKKDVFSINLIPVYLLLLASFSLIFIKNNK